MVHEEQWKLRGASQSCRELAECGALADCGLSLKPPDSIADSLGRFLASSLWRMPRTRACSKIVAAVFNSKSSAIKNLQRLPAAQPEAVENCIRHVVSNQEVKNLTTTKEQLWRGQLSQRVFCCLHSEFRGHS